MLFCINIEFRGLKLSLMLMLFKIVSMNEKEYIALWTKQDTELK